MSNDDIFHGSSEMAIFKDPLEGDIVADLVTSLINEFKMSNTRAAILREFINCCDMNGRSRVTQKTIAKRKHCSESTVERHVKELIRMKLISIQRTEWGKPNITTLLFIQHFKTQFVVGDFK